METQVKSKTAERELSISRLLNAPVELVWEVWTNPEHIKQWWGPNGFTNTIYKMDVKEGGEWDFTMHGSDGANFRNTHKFMELKKNERIILFHATAPNFQMEVNFQPQGNKTMISIRSVFESAEQLKKVIEVFKADVGLKQNVDKLENYLNNMPAEHELVIMRQFNAPREVVFKALTEAEHLAKWWGPEGSAIVVNNFTLKPGGMFLYSMKQVNGQEMWSKFIYKEIIAPNSLIFVSSFSDKDGNTTRNPWMPVWPLEVENTVTLIEYEGKTTLTIKGKPINATDEEVNSFALFRESMQGGFAGTFDQLEEYLSTINN